MIKRLRRYANDYDKGRSLGRYIQGTAEVLLSAADCIEKKISEKKKDDRNVEKCKTCEEKICATCSVACSDWCEECEMCGGLQGLTPKNYNPQNFCHDCGRPLNKEAEEVFNRRLKGEQK